MDGPQNQRDPEVVAFEHAVRHDAVVNKIKFIYRRSALNRASRAWWFRALLRKGGK